MFLAGFKTALQGVHISFDPRIGAIALQGAESRNMSLPEAVTRFRL